MANMSYCRFRNTDSDLLDCINALQTLVDNNGVDDYDEELSSEEQNAVDRMYQHCQEFVALYDELRYIIKD
jgi:hypothetical protein